ncbi:MAG: glycosyltransferase family 39 protein [candidate division WOR-3 bacterium]
MKTDRSLNKPDAVALVLVLAGLVLRILTARGTWLNPDEALNYLIANQPNLTAVYRASLTNPHPPLYFFLLYCWRLLGTSEIFLRLFSVLASGGAIWFFYRWLKRAINSTAGLAGTFLFAFLPALVGNGTEVRSYSLMLLLATVSLMLLEQGVQENCWQAMLFAGLFSALAGAAHYSALWFSIAAGIYFLIYVFSRKLNSRVVAAGFTGNLSAGLVYLLLYLTHLKNIRNSPMTRFAVTGWLKENYLQPGENPLVFIGRNTFGFFRYLSGSDVLAIILLVLFISGITTLALSRSGRRQALLIVLPLLLMIAGAVAGLMPYGGTRHSILLGLFATAGIAGLGMVEKPVLKRMLPAGCGLLALLSNLLLSYRGQHISRADNRLDRMHRAIAYLQLKVPPGDTLFTDYQGSALLSYYLADRTQPVEFFGRMTGDFREFDYGGYLVTSIQDWDFNQHRHRFGALVDRLYQHYGWQPDRVLWVFDGGWGMPLMPREEFGRNLSVFAVVPELILPQARAESLLFGAAEHAKELGYHQLRTWLIPSRYTSVRLVEKLRGFGVEVLTYDSLYRLVRQERAQFDLRLPALAFWLFNCYEPHPEFMSYMADGESYIAGDYRFTLLLMDSNREIAVYRLERN